MISPFLSSIEKLSPIKVLMSPHEGEETRILSFTKYNLTTKRPALGLSPLSYKKFLGMKSKKNYKVDDYIKN